MNSRTTLGNQPGEPPTSAERRKRKQMISLSDVSNVLSDAGRLDQIQKLELVDSPAEEAFDRITRLAVGMLDVPVSIVSIVTTERQFFKSALGLGEPWASRRQTPLDHSFCKHVVVHNQPVVVSDARQDEVFRNNLAIPNLGVIAYLGFPLGLADGLPLGAFCVIDTKPRHWSEVDIQRVRDLSMLAANEIELRNEIEKVNQANVAKSEFLANMSHEVRTPLTSILGYADEILEVGGSDLDDETRQSLGVISNSGEHLLDLINGILDLSKIEAGKLTLRNTWYSPAELVADVIKTVRINSGDVAVELSGSIEVVEEIEGDPTRVKQVLINLVGNAVKFTEQGSVQVDMCVEVDGQQHYLVTSIRDTGIGIPESQLEAIFEPFVQVDGSMKRRFGGTGLGLPVSRHIAREMGGDILVESTAGAGSCFTLKIPFEEKRDKVSLDVAKEISVADGTFDYSILVAEDTKINQRLLESILTKKGARVEVASNGREALEMIVGADKAGKPYDVVLLDIQMPEMDGYEVANTLREMGNPTPLIACTANAMQGDDQLCIAAGCVDYLTKPIRKKEMFAAIVRYAGKRYAGK